MVWPTSMLIFLPFGVTWPSAMVMSMVTESAAALVSLGEGVGVADALGLAERRDGLGVALVTSGVGVAVASGALVQPARASPASTPPATNPHTRRRVGEPLIARASLVAVAVAVRVEVT